MPKTNTHAVLLQFEYIVEGLHEYDAINQCHKLIIKNTIIIQELGREGFHVQLQPDCIATHR